MITFRPMFGGEFTRYLEYFVPDYAAEISTNYGVSASDALVMAQREIARDLPLGPETPGQLLFCIIKDNSPGTVIGYVWYCPDEERRSVFICDFCILPEQRGNGQGRRALVALEAMLHTHGYSEIKLRVAADNSRAQHVYKAGGFRVTGFNMVKQIGQSGEQE
ncbi:GNAT family N-acetyltransferase (plasmid) [Rhizobium sp. RCAM05350]|nr:GNAT family N-acetyltransferase [Rhizobium sp. RCAM05350]